MKRKILLVFILFIMVCWFASCRQAPQAPQRAEETEEPSLKVYIAETGKIKDMKLEDYLQGVLAGEIDNNWHIEALSAQAILARTYTMNFLKTKESKYPGADISTDIEEAQAWNEEAINDRIKEAIQKTRGKVALYNDGYIRAWFHANAGGKTATAKEGLAYRDEEPPYIKVVDSPDLDQQDGTWEETFTADEIIQAANKIGSQIDKIESISIGKKGPSGRAVKLKINGEEISAPELRISVGSQKMRSTFLTEISDDGNTIFMKGRGYGHGVGMSQWGAKVLAEEGKSAEEIVRFFFDGIEIKKLWE